MNKIFKKIWSESRGCFVVVSETASSISRSKGKVTSLILVTFLTASNVFALTTHNGNVELGWIFLTISAGFSQISVNVS